MRFNAYPPPPIISPKFIVVTTWRSGYEDRFEVKRSRVRLSQSTLHFFHFLFLFIFFFIKSGDVFKLYFTLFTTFRKKSENYFRSNFSSIQTLIRRFGDL